MKTCVNVFGRILRLNLSINQILRAIENTILTTNARAAVTMPIVERVTDKQL